MRLRDIINEDAVDLSGVSIKRNKHKSGRFDAPEEVETYTFRFPLARGGELEAYVRAAGETLEFADLVFIQGQRNPDTFATGNHGGTYSAGVRLGTSETRRLLSYVVKTVKDDHPEIKKLSSTRVTGARMASGKMNMDMALPVGLSEAVELIDVGGERVKVLRGCNGHQAVEAMESSQYKKLRGLCAGENYFLWDAALATHSRMAEELGLDWWQDIDAIFHLEDQPVPTITFPRGFPWLSSTMRCLRPLMVGDLIRLRHQRFHGTLFDYEKRDMEGSSNHISEAATDSPAFKRWFGNSKAVDAQGNPLRLFHGTLKDFTAFSTNAPRRTRGGRAGAFFFSPNQKIASAYAGTAEGYQWNDDTNGYDSVFFGMQDGGNVMPVYLSLQNPLIVDAEERLYADVEDDAFKAAKEGGHDGIIFRNVGDSPGAQGSLRAYVGDAYVAFRPEQIKSVFAREFDASKPGLSEAANSAAADLEQLIADAAEVGVNLRAHIKSRKAIELDMITRTPTGKKGAGAEVMQALCDFADAKKMRIHTYVMSFDPKLVEFYEKFFFEEDPKGDDEAYMVRYPE